MLLINDVLLYDMKNQRFIIDSIIDNLRIDREKKIVEVTYEEYIGGFVEVPLCTYYFETGKYVYDGKEYDIFGINVEFVESDKSMEEILSENIV